jgi:ATP-dependent Lon protease
VPATLTQSVKGPQEHLDSKLRRSFPDQIVNKKLYELREVSRLPRFIAESAIKRFCGDNVKPKDLAEMAKFVNRYYPEAKMKDRVLHELFTKGQYTLLDELKVRVDIKNGIHKVEVPCLGIYNARVRASLLEKHKDLLEAGIWGVSTLNYSPEFNYGAQQELNSPIIMTEFEPLQYSTLNIEEFNEKRKHFSTEEWICAIINTIGLNPDVYSHRQRLLLLSRLVTLVEQNVNVLELGPRATGKSFLFKNISYYTRLFSGGQVSPAVLFYHGNFKTLGEIGVRECVIFDEISKVEFNNPDEMMGKLKDYMESGEYERGTLKRVRSTCSLVFMGNVEVRGNLPAEEFSNVIPECMRDSAFVDRIHGFIPGWELPKIMQSDLHLSKGYGFVSQYFCEVMNQLRKEDFQHHIAERVELSAEGGNIGIRDEKSIRKIASGILKILCPHGEFSTEELGISMDIAIELRQRVHDWLCKLSPGEFEIKRLCYSIKN